MVFPMVYYLERLKWKRIVDCDSRRAVGPTKTIRGVFMTQLNRLERLAVLSALREGSFYV